MPDFSLKTQFTHVGFYYTMYLNSVHVLSVRLNFELTDMAYVKVYSPYAGFSILSSEWSFGLSCQSTVILSLGGTKTIYCYL